MGHLARVLGRVGAAVGIMIFSSTGTLHAAPTLTRVTVAMGYIANVQFAPFYVAVAKGYYRSAGLDVHFQYGVEPDLLRLASSGQVDFVNSGGDEVLTAGAQGLHVLYVMTQYSRFPAAIFSLRSAGIRSVIDLRGRSVGVPGPYGASYVGLLALLGSVHLSRKDVSIKTIGFTQAEAVAHHRVDAAVGYAMNEPVQLRQEGYRVSEMDIYRNVNLAGAGIVASQDEIRRRPQIVRAFVAATLHGLRDTLQHPGEAFVDAEQAVPEIRAQPGIQRAVLNRSLAFWQPEPRHSLGWIDPAVWSRTADLLLRFRQVPHAVTAHNLYTNRFIPSR